jgi:hypothetical protein
MITKLKNKNCNTNGEKWPKIEGQSQRVLPLEGKKEQKVTIKGLKRHEVPRKVIKQNK